MATRKPDAMRPHPNGGTLRFYDLENGRRASVLDPAYEHNTDWEIHEREADEGIPIEDSAPIPRTERHADTEAAALAILTEIEALEPRDV